MKGTIKLGRPTANHAATLQELGYDAKVEGEVIVINGITGTVDDFDATAPGAAEKIVEMVKEKKVFTYSTKILTEKGTRTAHFACPTLIALGAPVGIDFSALMVKMEKAGGEKAVVADPAKKAAFLAALKK
jgi:hypothetical protein